MTGHAVRWGLLSTALINEAILAGAAETQAAEVVAVASRDASRARAYADEHGIELAFGSYDALLESGEVDAVYVSLPNSLHVEWTLKALDAGKHVLVEKPLSRHPDQVEQMFDRAERAGLVVSEAFMWRHHPLTRRLVEIVRAGTVGRPRVARAAFGFSLEAERGLGDTRFDPGLDGGALMDVGCYCVSALRLLGGEPARARGERVDGTSGVDVVFAGTLALEDELVGEFDCGFVYPRRAELELVGEEATLQVRGPFGTDREIVVVRDGADPEVLAATEANHYALELENVSGAIRGGEPLLLGRDDAVGQAHTIARLYASAGRT